MVALNGRNYSIRRCLDEVKDWLADNLVQLNERKTEIMIFGRTVLNKAESVILGPWACYIQDRVKNLGVIFDSSLKFDNQINTVVRNCFFYLRAIAKLKSFLSTNDLENVFHAFIFSRLDYCNAIYVGTCQTHIARLQLVQNAAARMLMKAKKSDHITPLLSSLGWLPVHYRIQYKVLIYVFKALHGTAPEYLVELIKPFNAKVSLRSSNKLLLTIPRVHLKSKGYRAFAVSGPRLWNSLPFEVRASLTLSTFKCRLKSYLFSLAF